MALALSTCTLIGSLLLLRTVPASRGVRSSAVVACPIEPWPPSRCFLEQIADSDARLTAVGVNWGYLDMFDHWRRLAVRAGVRNYVVLAYDNRTYAELRRRRADPVLRPISTESESGPVEYATDGFRRLTRTRPRAVLALVELGFAVFYADVDTAFRANPYAVFDDVLARDPLVDVIVSEDGADGYWCSCLLYLRPTAAARHLLRTWAAFADLDATEDDQVALNRAKANVSGQYRPYTVPGAVFPSGKVMWIQGYDWGRHPQGPVVVHANYLHGHDRKMEALRDTGLWNRSRT